MNLLNVNKHLIISVKMDELREYLEVLEKDMKDLKDIEILERLASKLRGIIECAGDY